MNFDDYFNSKLDNLFDTFIYAVPTLDDGRLAAVPNNNQSLIKGKSTGNFSSELVESDKDYAVRMEVAGIPKENIKVSLKNNLLCVEGERKEEIDEKKEKYHFRERLYGKFSRSFRLPEDCELSTCTSSLSDGVLEVKFEKQAPSKNIREIEIK